jgi:DNA helicase-2/ATP-dependent DNA helicase PcrA
LRLVAFTEDDTAFERIINVPARGIGDKTLMNLRALAETHQCSLWQATHIAVTSTEFSPKITAAFQYFQNMITEAQTLSKTLSLKELTDHMIEVSGLYAMYRNEKSDRAEARTDNLKELVTAAGDYSAEGEERDLPPLTAFLSHVALEAGEAQAPEHADYVQLMTLHAAKGLEFPVVFMGGLEDGLFPHQMSLGNAKGLEEERRLCYVGMTRAMQKLYLTHAEVRRMQGREQYCSRSRFVHEIPKNFIQEVQRRTDNPSLVSVSTRQSSQTVAGFKLGQIVSHPTFGDGVILNFEGSGAHTRIQIQFENHGVKWLVAQFAKLDVVQ